MNNELRDRLDHVESAKENLSDAEGLLHSFLEPILEVLGAKGGGISYVSIDSNRLRIERTGSCRGYRWDDDYAFPLSIFTSDDPLKAAAEYVAADKKQKELEERNKKLEELKRLQKELEV